MIECIRGLIKNLGLAHCLNSFKLTLLILYEGWFTIKTRTCIDYISYVLKYKNLKDAQI